MPPLLLWPHPKKFLTNQQNARPGTMRPLRPDRPKHRNHASRQARPKRRKPIRQQKPLAPPPRETPRLEIRPAVKTAVAAVVDADVTAKKNRMRRLVRMLTVRSAQKL